MFLKDISKDVLWELISYRPGIIIYLPLERGEIIPLETIQAHDQSFATRWPSHFKGDMLLVCSHLVLNKLGYSRHR